MHEFIEQRIKEEANFMIQSKATVRAIAKQFYVSKSTTYKDLTERLKLVAPELHGEIIKILKTNKMERHIRGGETTKKRYKKVRTCRTRNVLA